MAMDIRSDKLLILKIGTIILGIICVAFTAACYNKYEDKDKYYLAIGIIALIISIILLILIQLGVLKAFKPELIDGGCHLVLAALLFIGAIVWAVSISDSWKWETGSSKRALRVISCLLGFINPVLYVVIGLKRFGFL